MKKLKISDVFQYIHSNIPNKQRSLEMEKLIIEDFKIDKESANCRYELIIDYAENVLNNRWPEVEKYIKKSPYAIVEYTKKVIKQRWFEAEKIILTHPRYSWDYTRNIIKGKWKEGEKVIYKNKQYKKWYKELLYKNKQEEQEKEAKKYQTTK